MVNWHHRPQHKLQDFPKDTPYHLGFHSVEAFGDPDFKDLVLDLRTFLLGAGLAFALLAAFGLGDPSVETLPLEEGALPVPGAATAGFIPLG